MNMPPTIMKVRVNRFGIWLPLFIIMPIALVFALALAPLILLAAIILWPWGYGRPLVMLLPCVLGCLNSLKGLEVDVENSHDRVHIYLK